MDSTQRIVTCTPLTELWNSKGQLDAGRAENVGETDIVQLLRDGSSFVVAEVGQPLRWISEGDRFAFWKAEVKCRLVPPGTDGLHLDDYPGNYRYVAAMWKCASSSKTEVAALRRDVCFAPVSGHRQAVSACPKSAKGLNRSRGRALRRAAWPCQQWMERWERLT
jgi:hypothetical protein